MVVAMSTVRIIFKHLAFSHENHLAKSEEEVKDASEEANRSSSGIFYEKTVRITETL